jgi:hypothetical protein
METFPKGRKESVRKRWAVSEGRDRVKSHVLVGGNKPGFSHIFLCAPLEDNIRLMPQAKTTLRNN